MTSYARWRRRGMAALEVVLAFGVSFPMAAAMYLLFERGMDQFFLALGTAVGSPYF